MLSAEDGAVRAQVRRRRPIDRADDTPGYSCENCGRDEFHVVKEWLLECDVDWFLPCSCGDHESAAVRTTQHSTLHQTIYALDEEHRMGDELCSEQLGDTEQEEVNFESNCQTCHEAHYNDEHAWEEEAGDSKVYVEKLSVCCAECGHESEYGWSHPGRGGRIWPVEADDFNPWLSWPEPRFADAWARRKWLRPRSH